MMKYSRATANKTAFLVLLLGISMTTAVQPDAEQSNTVALQPEQPEAEQSDAVASQPEQPEAEQSKILMNEEPCLQEGGICVVAGSCREYQRVNRTGLCPKQEAIGAECCNGIPIGEGDCTNHGGRCGGEAECKNVQRFGQLNCQQGEECCLLAF